MENFLMSFIILYVFVFFLSPSEGQQNSRKDDNEGSLTPSLIVIIGILSVLFSVSTLLVIYIKFCYFRDTGGGIDLQGLFGPISRRFSGIDRTVIESLPLFRFSSLKGHREGLECPVCISIFEEDEVLRLLPKCKHAFHVECIDRWLENHSSCPLCRHKIDPDDESIFTYSSSLRFTRNLPNNLPASDVELIVHREADGRGGSSRFSVESSFRKADKKTKNSAKKKMVTMKEKEIDEDEDDMIFQKLNHRSISSDIMFYNRWSDLNSCDIMFLNSGLIRYLSSEKFPSSNFYGEFSERKSKNLELGDGSFSDVHMLKIKEEMERKRLLESKLNKIKRSHSFSNYSSKFNQDSYQNLHSNSMLPTSNKRSMSEITNMQRFSNVRWKNGGRRDCSRLLYGNDERDVKLKKIWLPIACRTIQWVAGKEKRILQNGEQQNSFGDSIV